jgi:hypothetical protein
MDNPIFYREFLPPKVFGENGLDNKCSHAQRASASGEIVSVEK